MAIRWITWIDHWLDYAQRKLLYTIPRFAGGLTNSDWVICCLAMKYGVSPGEQQNHRWMLNVLPLG